MKNLLIMVVVLAALYGLAKRGGHLGGSEPGEIKNPIYMALRAEVQLPGRTVDFLVFTKTANERDCRAQEAEAANGLKLAMDKYQLPYKVRPVECLTTLEKRHAYLFEDLPSVVTYLSIARGQPKEREIRMLYLGVSQKESDMLCDLVPDLQKKVKGKVSCIVAPR